VLGGTPAFVADSRHPHRSLDLPGLLLAVIAIASLQYAVIEGGQDGFGQTKIIAAFAVALAATLVFLVVQARSRSPVLHLSLFRISSFSTANVVGGVGQYALVGVAIAEVVYFERIRGDSILATGLRMLALMASYAVVSSVAGPIVRRAGFKQTIAAGLLLSAAGVLFIVTQPPSTGFAVTAVLLAMLGVGSGLIMPPATAVAIVSVPHSEWGMASATFSMFRQLASSLGASITGTILTSGLASRLRTELVHHGLAAGPAAHLARAASSGSVAADPPRGVEHTILVSVGRAFVGALHVAVLIPGLAALLAAAATVAFIRNLPAP
jgi:DHA2 family multidrug resistance protein-like MFS transporter